MIALVAQGVGEPADVVGLEPRPPPEPGDGEALVRVRAAPHGDLHVLRRRYGYTPEFPNVFGSEGVGVVEAVGAGVDTIELPKLYDLGDVVDAFEAAGFDVYRPRLRLRFVPPYRRGEAGSPGKTTSRSTSCPG